LVPSEIREVKKLRILFVDTAVEISIADSARGYLGALKRQGHDIHHFKTSSRIRFVATALQNGPNPEMVKDFRLVSQLASEMIVVEALKHRADLIVVSSGLALHQDGLELATRAGFPIALILTESPYEDDHQAKAARHSAHVFTNDASSAVKHPSWHYLPSAYDPEYHHPFPSDPQWEADVLFVGTGWPERQALLEGVNWEGIKLRLMGMWPGVDETSPLSPYLMDTQVSNDETARLYSSAKIAVNHHRYHPEAISLNPRGYELGGCGVFQISDWRPELEDVYGSTVPTYRDSAELEAAIRGALSWAPQTLKSKSIEQHERLVAGYHTFDHRAALMIYQITSS
jgi:glycosyl transferase family 1